KLYVDGHLTAVSTWFDGADYDLSNDRPLRIGAGANDSFAGLMSDLRLYDRALGPSELARLATVDATGERSPGPESAQLPHHQTGIERQLHGRPEEPGQEHRVADLQRRYPFLRRRHQRHAVEDGVPEVLQNDDVALGAGLGGNRHFLGSRPGEELRRG